MTIQKRLNTVTDLQLRADEREVDMGGSADAVLPMIIDRPVRYNSQCLLDEYSVTYQILSSGPFHEQFPSSFC